MGRYDADADAMTRRRIAALFGRMPYGAMAQFQWSGDRWSAPAPTLADIEANLERLRSVLERTAEDDTARLAELNRLRRAIAGATELAAAIEQFADDLLTAELDEVTPPAPQPG